MHSCRGQKKAIGLRHVEFEAFMEHRKRFLGETKKQRAPLGVG